MPSVTMSAMRRAVLFIRMGFLWRWMDENGFTDCLKGEQASTKGSVSLVKSRWAIPQKQKDTLPRRIYSLYHAAAIGHDESQTTQAEQNVAGGLGDG